MKNKLFNILLVVNFVIGYLSILIIDYYSSTLHPQFPMITSIADNLAIMWPFALGTFVYGIVWQRVTAYLFPSKSDTAIPPVKGYNVTPQQIPARERELVISLIQAKQGTTADRLFLFGLTMLLMGVVSHPIVQFLLGQMY